MSEFRLTKRDQEHLKEEMAKWKNRLNLTVAPILFAGSATFVPLAEASPFYGLVLLVFSLALIKYIVDRDFPKTLKNLREKERKTEREEMIEKGIERHYLLRWKSILDFFLYWISCLFVTFVSLESLWNWPRWWYL